MIKAFKCKETEKIFNGRFSRKLPRSIQPNHLEALKGKWKGQHSIRINDQWRICFEWHDDGVYNVEITDYH